MKRLWGKGLVLSVLILLIFLLISIIQVSAQTDYYVGKVKNSGMTEYRIYYKCQHFLTVIYDRGTFNIRPHPGVDMNGWGSSLYMQPFLPGAVLKYTEIQSIIAYEDRIEIKAIGYVSKNLNEKYGTWSISLSFSYNPLLKEISGNGNYKISLQDKLSSSTGDLNLFKIASNYLDDVPLLGNGIGDTGDMEKADVVGDDFSFTWIPPNEPGHFPTDETDNLLIDVSGDFNNVDSAAQGYKPIKPAYKPSLKVKLISNIQNIPMAFGGSYDLNKKKMFWEDNVGITPLILKKSGFLNYDFDVEFNSKALEDDGTLRTEEIYLISPDDGEEFSRLETENFEWSAIVGFNDFDIQISQTPDFLKKKNLVNNVKYGYNYKPNLKQWRNLRKLANTDSNGILCWRVYGTGNKVKAYSNVNIFTLAPPTPPFIISPINKKINETEVFLWGLGTYTRARVQVSTLQSFLKGKQTIYISGWVKKENGQAFTINKKIYDKMKKLALDNGVNTLYWRVEVLDDEKLQDFSELGNINEENLVESSKEGKFLI